MALPWDFRHGRRKMQIRCNLLHAADSYRQNIKMGGARMDTFDVIFTTYSPLVFRYLRSLCGDAAVAEELTAETFYRAYTHFDSFRGDSKLETWLCAIAKNAYLKDCRRSARTVGADALETLPAETDFVERFLDLEQAQQIYRHVHELGAQYKEVFLLRTLSALEQYDPDNHIKISVIDFLTGLDTCFEKDRIICAQGGIYIPVQIACGMLEMNAILNGGRLGGQAWDVPISFGAVGSAEEFKDYSKFCEGALPTYTFEELQNLFITYNPDVTGEDIIAWGNAFNLADIYAAHADLAAPVKGPNGVEYVPFAK